MRQWQPTSHTIALVGFGESEQGEKYWGTSECAYFYLHYLLIDACAPGAVARNSWGSSWATSTLSLCFFFLSFVVGILSQCGLFSRCLSFLFTRRRHLRWLLQNPPWRERVQHRIGWRCVRRGRRALVRAFDFVLESVGNRRWACFGRLLGLARSCS